MKDGIINNLSDLSPAEYNPRRITDEALHGLKYSIDEFGDLSGITFNLTTNNLVTGHQRVTALKDQYGDIKIVRDAENADRGWIITPSGESFVLRFVRWDLKKEKAANVAANSSTIQGEFTDGLKLILEEIKLEVPDIFASLKLEELKFPDIELNLPGVDAEDSETEEDGFDMDQALKEIDVPRTQPGDIYLLGNHRLMCGDSANPDDVALLMGTELAQLIFTDPPYNVNYQSPSGLSYNSSRYGNSGRIFNDNKTDADCLTFYTDVLKNLFEISKDDAAIYWWFAMGNIPLSIEAFELSGWHRSQVLIWVKNGLVFSFGQDYHRAYEPCMFGWKKKNTHYKNKDLNNLVDVFNIEKTEFNSIADVWYQKRDATHLYVHPTQKPIGLAERALRKNSRDQDIVVDLFGGSGSTLLACHQMNRRARLMELDPKYCDAIVKRYLQFTGDTTVIKNNQPEDWSINNA